MNAETRRAAAYRQLCKDLATAPYEGLPLGVDRWRKGHPWRNEQSEKQAALSALPIAAFAAELLVRRRDKVLTLGHGFADLPTEDRRMLRLALKKLRYGVEFCAAMFKMRAVKPFVDSLKTLQDDLGHLNDVAVAETLPDNLIGQAGKTDVRRSAGLMIGWHDRSIFTGR